ncbi:hypothetical protein BD626DRAFT_572276 [Schizophyllum amplum]|uniref:Uncharacterized protein n=1 Tax=Schizophyllum amplum TaxID=97359 RepID=A0A550C595_9AGAR|nr:hypothetical protein BD626DRAFT_572276 [Auriculariopsis ampla]
MPATLSITSKNMLNAPLCLPDGTVAFTTSTEKHLFKGRGITAFQGQSHFAHTHAEINWKNKYFDINGEVLPHNRIMQKSGGLFSRRVEARREVIWPNLDVLIQPQDMDIREFVVELHYDNKEWTAKSPTTNVIIGRFRSRRERLLHDDENATLTIDVDLASPEAMFLILAFMYSETRRLDNVKTSDTAGAGVEVGGAIAGAFHRLKWHSGRKLQDATVC